MFSHTRWRAPMRAAFDQLRDLARAATQPFADKAFVGFWEARDAYVALLAPHDHATLDAFFGTHLSGRPTAAVRRKAHALLDYQPTTSLRDGSPSSSRLM